MGNRNWNFQLKDSYLGEIIDNAGGKCFVATTGTPRKAALLAKSGAVLANPVTPVRGFIDFYVEENVDSVDLYIQAPGGQFVVAVGVRASGPNEIPVDVAEKRQVYKIPFSFFDDAGDAVETDTGFDLPAKAFVLDRLHGCGLDVTAIDATETIDVGTLTGETGADPNGLIAAHTVGTLGLAIGTNGALFSSNAPYPTDSLTAKSISYTLTAGSDTGEGFILLPLVLTANF